MTRLGIIEGTQAFLHHVLDDDRLKDKIGIVSSFGTEAALPLALVTEVNPHVPAILVDIVALRSEGEISPCRRHGLPQRARR